jgi:hypothetical protein
LRLELGQGLVPLRLAAVGEGQGIGQQEKGVLAAIHAQAPQGPVELGQQVLAEVAGGGYWLSGHAA